MLSSSRSAGGEYARRLIDVFSAEGDAMHGAFVMTCQDLGFGCFRLLARPIEREGDEGAQLLVESFGARDLVIHVLERRKFART